LPYFSRFHIPPIAPEDIMRRSIFAALAVGASLFAGLTAASAYEIDPLTRQPLLQNPEGFKAQATAIPREVVSYSGKHAPGTIVIDTKERRLYFVMSDGKAMRYGVGVGRPGFEWGGSMAISRKQEWPTWTPPPQMIKRRPDLPRFMPGGPENPMGARAMYLGSSLYRIHGSNEPETIGQAVSSGCIRMVNDDVIDLFERARVGTRVVVQR
jgi:lipoprotein-anchoring transpeptidase ErfK/SrfK